MLLSLRLISLIILLFCTCSSSVTARWATREEAAIEYLSFVKSVDIKKNGHSLTTTAYRIKILNELGRDNFGTLRFYYVKGLDHFKIIGVTVYDKKGKKFHVTPDMIEDKPLASDASGFDETHQVLISLPYIAVGCEIEVNYQIIRVQQPLDGYFSDNTVFDQSGIFKSAEIHYTSDIPFHLLTNDLRGNLKVTTSKDGKAADIQLINPIFESLVDEPGSHLTMDDHTWVAMTSTDKHEDLGKLLTPKFEEVINEPLPDLFNKLAINAKSHSSFKDQVNYLTSTLATKIRYMKDFRSYKGRLYPRSLETVAKNTQADCKEYSAALVAMLRSLGYEAYVALVERGFEFIPFKKKLPPLDNYNHAIVYAKDHDGKEYWIDPTNNVSMADGTFPDISARPALILKKDASTVKDIPAVNPDHAKTLLEKTVTFKNADTLTHKGTLTLYGENALLVTGKALYESPKMIEDSIINLLSDSFMPEVREVKLPDLHSRIVQDVSFDFSFENKNSLIYTNYGQGMRLGSEILKTFLYTIPDAVGTKFIDGPFTLIKIIHAQGIIAKETHKLNASIDSPWVKATRTCLETKNGIEIKTEIKFIKNYITPQEVRSPAYQKLKEDIQKNFVDIAMIFKPT